MRRLGLAAVCAVMCCAALLAGQAGGQAQRGGQPTPPDPKSPYLKLAEPWPDADAMQKRRADAEKLPLFATADPLVFTITADFKSINKDRDPESTRRFPGVLTLAAPDGSMATVEVLLGTRGHARLNVRTCDFVPLRVEFVEPSVKGTVFDGQDSLKLVTHCWEDSGFQQYVLREYLVYRIFNLHTPRSFRARLAKVTYVDSASGKRVAGRHAIFLEDDGDVARRMMGRIIETPRVVFRDLEPESTTLMSLLQYMIGNTDYSIYVLHNVRLVQDQARVLSPLVYDFDMSGLVNTHYAVAEPKLGILSVRDRLYRGPCRTMQELEPLVAKMRAKQQDVLALYDSLPELSERSRKDARSFLAEFYATLARPDRIRKAFIDGCEKNAVM